MLREVEGIEVGGCLVLLLDKQSPKFSEYVLDFSNDEHKKFIEECEETFMSLVYSFYNKKLSFCLFFKEKAITLQP